MAKKSLVLLPKVARALEELGENIRMARLRRKLSATLLAERMGVSRATLRAVERGEGGVSMAGYAAALHGLGLLDDLTGVARDDALGRTLQDAGLGVRKRAPKRPARD